MKGASTSMNPPQVDITAPEGDIVIEVDAPRGVLYVHIEGFTCLSLCQVKGTVIMTSKELRGRETTAYVHRVGESQ